MRYIDWKYPLIFDIDLEPTYKSIWLGWWLITWRFEWDDVLPQILDIDVAFQPGL